MAIIQGIEDQVMVCSLGPETGSVLSAECPRADVSLVKAILEQLYYADKRTNWHVEMANDNIAIRTDRHPTFCYLSSVASLGKGMATLKGRPIRHIGRELLERIEAGI